MKEEWKRGGIFWDIVGQEDALFSGEIEKPVPQNLNPGLFICIFPCCLSVDH